MMDSDDIKQHVLKFRREHFSAQMEDALPQETETFEIAQRQVAHDRATIEFHAAVGIIQGGQLLRSRAEADPAIKIIRQVRLDFDTESEATEIVNFLIHIWRLRLTHTQRQQIAAALAFHTRTPINCVMDAMDVAREVHLQMILRERYPPPLESRVIT